LCRWRVRYAYPPCVMATFLRRRVRYAYPPWGMANLCRWRVRCAYPPCVMANLCAAAGALRLPALRNGSPL
ncbi:hypothetical protein QBS70_01855, partial [Cronobacter sakazakii]|nr:hypothetical protein [Cronobacter sakazakii]